MGKSPSPGIRINGKQQRREEKEVRRRTVANGEREPLATAVHLLVVA
jgi:hypothetical protein